jgi:hypothetical protein
MTWSGGAPSRHVARCSRPAIGRLALLATVAALVAPKVGVLPASNRVAPLVEPLVAVGGVPGEPSGAQRVGPLAAARVVSLGVALRPRNPGALRVLATAVSIPGSALYHRYLTPRMFAAEFGPSAAATAAVERALRESRLRVGTVSVNGLIIPVTGTVGEVESAFHTHLDAYRLSGGMTGWAPVMAPRLPSRIAGAVSAVLGLDNLVVPHSMMLRKRNGRSAEATAVTPSRAASLTWATPKACEAATLAAQGNDGWTEDEVAQAYGLTGLYAAGGLGGGQTIGVLELEPFVSSDVASFDRCFFGSDHTSVIRTIPIDGFDLHGFGTGEAVLDLEMLAALAPEANLDVYEAPNTSFGPIDAYNAMVSDDQANILSTSWGECETSLQISEPGVQQVENYIFEEAAAQGQTVLASSGDTGSDDCAGTQFSTTKPVRPYLSVDDPASQPYVVGVGGTSLLSDTPPLGSGMERVWNDGPSEGGTGGGMSNSWASPVWQAESGVPGTENAARRLVPDVSSAADERRGVTFYSASFASSSAGAWSTLGGTSVAAPTWAAILADIASSPGGCSSLPVTAGGPDLGFVAPELYAVAASSYTTSFNDITVGNNDVFHLGLGYDAGVGYNLASGLGSPIVTGVSGGGGLATALCAVATESPGALLAPVVTGITPAYGPTTGGNGVTLTGSGFSIPGSSLHVEFGVSPAVVDTVSATSLTVTVPPSAAPPRTAPEGAAGAVDVSVTITDGSSEATSATTAASLYDYVAENAASLVVPSVAAISPPAGNLAGGGSVTIWGSGFSTDGVPSVSFGGIASPAVTVVHDYEIRARVPAESPATACTAGVGFSRSTVCQVEVTVTTPDGTSATAPILPSPVGPVVFAPQGVIERRSGTEVAPAATEYDYVPTPTVSLVVAGRSDSSPVRIFGSGFSVLAFDWVNLGPASLVESEQTKIDYLTPTSIVVTPTAPDPTGGSATVFAGGVSVQTAGGLSNVVASPGAGELALRSLSVLGGPTAGGTEIKISGSGLSGTRFVAFVGELSPWDLAVAPRSMLTRVSADALTVRTPAHLGGPVDVVPCSARRCALALPSVDTFVYVGPEPRSLVALSPAAGPASGGAAVTIFGRNVDEVSAALFGPAVSGPVAPAPDYPPGDSFVAEVRTPPGVAGSRVAVATLVSGRRVAVLRGILYRYLASAPSPPRSLGLVRAGAVVVLTWEAPASDGGSPITSYFVVASTPGMAARTWHFGPRSRAARLVGLSPRLSHEFTVMASNAAHGRGLPAVLAVPAKEPS